jgi:hypothetical protein
MGWNDYSKVEQEQMLNMLEGALKGPPEPQPMKPVVHREWRNAVLIEIKEYIERYVPAEMAYTLKLAMLDYACRKIAEEADDDEEEDAFKHGDPAF